MAWKCRNWVMEFIRWNLMSVSVVCRMLSAWAIGCIGYYTHETSNIPIGENDCEVGYWVGKPHWNKGICTEALKLMLDYCIQVKHLENIWADHFTGNPASGKVMVKCGFSDTGMLNRCSQLVGGDKDMVKVFKYKGYK